MICTGVGVEGTDTFALHMKIWPFKHADVHTLHCRTGTLKCRSVEKTSLKCLHRVKNADVPLL